MHPKRIQVLSRILLLFGLLLIGGYLGYKKLRKPLPSLSSQVNEIRSVTLPTPQEQELLQKALVWVDEILPIAPPRLMPGIIAFKPPQMDFDLQLIFLGKTRFALINNIFYTVGSILPDGREILKITKQGVVVFNRFTDKKEFIKFSYPHTVRLKKPVEKIFSDSNLKDGIKDSLPPPPSQGEKSREIKNREVKNVLKIIKKYSP